MSNAETLAFLGPEPTWANARIELRSVHPLWGGHIIRVSGNGACSIRIVERGSQFEQRFSLDLAPTEVAALIQVFIQHDFCAIAPETPAELLPDTTSTTIRLSQNQRQHELHIWGDHPTHSDTAAILAAILTLKNHLTGLTAIYSGPYHA